ncbi:MAG: hypothetical protein LBQ31_11065 [Bacteroidales bacterium]|jgi:hypothetical protein|nr:hypothetical protein [Bacteroidales bacterium]
MKKILYIVLIGFLLTGCRKDPAELNDPSHYGVVAKNAVGNFDAFWHGMNNNYAFWGVDNTDWDKVYTTYRPLFEELDKDTASTFEEQAEKMYSYFVEMSENLVDGHCAILFNETFANACGARGISPSTIRKTKEGLIPYPTLWQEKFTQMENVWDRVLMDDEYLSVAMDYSGEELSELYITGRIAGSQGKVIPYLFFSSFSLLQNYYQGGDYTTVLDNFFASIMEDNVEGVIIDVRGNGGGNSADLSFLMGHFSTKDFIVVYNRSKAGEGRLDYSPWIPFRIMPMEGACKDFTVPIVVLADVHSVSCAEITTMAVKSLPNKNGHFIGQQTWGGHGLLTANVEYNGGQFHTIDYSNINKVSSYIEYVYTSSVTAKTAFDGKVYEGQGLPPDQVVALDTVKLNQGEDTQLEAAIDYILR